ncbi:MAG: M23 family metallopeptidase [Spirochaetaceae bacterium]|nr:M23 family metallopeptidase [Spirochaetaceae bacterium]
MRVLINIIVGVKWLFCIFSVLIALARTFRLPAVNNIPASVVSFVVMVFLLSWLAEIILRPKFTLQVFMQFFGEVYLFICNLKKKPNNNSAIEYSLPFEDEWLVVNGGIDKENSHSWDIQAQRYAYDFFITDKHCNSYKENKYKLENYYCYNQPILAPADGVVVEIGNRCRESNIMRFSLLDAYKKDIRGNYIVIKHEDEYSLIAHIIKDSFNVKVGEAVKRGQLIAKCGNSGNSSEPHIHFQVAAGSSFFASNSLKINFKNINLKLAQDYANKYKRKPTSFAPDGSHISRGFFASNKGTSCQ